MDRPSSQKPRPLPRRTILLALLATLAFAAGGQALTPAPAAAVNAVDCSGWDLFYFQCTTVKEAPPSGDGDAAGASDQPYRGMVPVGPGVEAPYEGTLTKQDLIELGALDPNSKENLGFGPSASPKEVWGLVEEWLDDEGCKNEKDAATLATFVATKQVADSLANELSVCHNSAIAEIHRLEALPWEQGRDSFFSKMKRGMKRLFFWAVILG